eukprot:scaffold2563_cov124-Cylindrotheca_fusiformis.AAC.1
METNFLEEADDHQTRSATVQKKSKFQTFFQSDVLPLTNGTAANLKKRTLQKRLQPPLFLTI